MTAEEQRRDDSRRASVTLNRCAALISENDRPLVQEKLRKLFIERPMRITAEDAETLYQELILISKGD